jgi:hypothetical protein
MSQEETKLGEQIESRAIVTSQHAVKILLNYRLANYFKVQSRN